MKIEVNCAYCKNIIFKYPYCVRPTNFCNITCKKQYQKTDEYIKSRWNEERKEIYSKKMSGENNPNFGKIWDDEQRKAMSNRLEIFNAKIGEEGRKERYGKSNRGLKRSEEYIKNWHTKQNMPNYKRRSKTAEEKILIGKRSKAKFTVEYKKKFRSRMEQLGLWRSREENDGFVGYNIDSNWIQKMFDVVELPIDFNLIGVFNPNTNTTGYCRDHKFSRIDGFRNKVFPEIIRHPENCAIIKHSENSSKSSKSSITIEQLFTCIKKYNGKWFEHEICLKLIERYENGERHRP